MGHRRFGSSPRVRGTGYARIAGDSRTRFIPACAGNSKNCQAAVSSNPVHPRVCGEQVTGAPGTPSVNGSSPRVRGTGCWLRGVRRRRRFIPACAGNSRVSAFPAPQLSVHPRVCGEQSIIQSSSWPRYGSSPRVRGTGGERGGGVVRERFIPACAGNSRILKRPYLRTAVHPRVCGEQAGFFNLHYSVPGSSPRVRGTA